jgi:hypothetical protein
MDDDVSDFFIPCEICSELILNAEYEEHLVLCDIDNINIHESMRLHSSYQVPRGRGTLRDFVNEHFNVDVPRRQRTSITSSFSSLASSPSSSILGTSPLWQTPFEPLRDKKGCKNINSHLLNTTDDEIGDASCCICLDTPTQQNGTKLKCKHIFCRKCISKWLEMNTNCPLCKVVLE